GVAHRVGSQPEAAPIRADDFSPAAHLRRRNGDDLHRAQTGAVQCRDNTDRDRPGDQAPGRTPMSESDDLDALVTELNAVAPQAHPAIREAPSSVADDAQTARLRAWLEQVIERSGSDLLLVAGAP